MVRVVMESPDSSNCHDTRMETEVLGLLASIWVLMRFAPETPDVSHVAKHSDVASMWCEGAQNYC